MIISALKPLDEIRKAVRPYQKLAIFGCGGCAAVCQSGGTKQVEELAGRLHDKQVLFTFQIDEPCDQRILTRELSRISGRLEDVEAVIVLTCGIGAQMVAASIEKPCFTGLNTLFPGSVIHSNKFSEICSTCGECVLNKTAGICPRTLCPKGIIFGPCSEKLDEHCSVNQDTECVWVKINRRREQLEICGDNIEFAPLDWSTQGAPREIPKKRLTISKEDNGNNNRNPDTPSTPR